MAADKQDSGRQGRFIAKLIAGTGVLYIVLQLIADQYGWSHRIRGLFDIAALVAFGYALWMTIKLWRATRETDGES